MRDGFFRLAREGDPHAGEVNENGHRPDRERAARLRESVVFPVELVDGFADGARLGLVLERYAVGETQHLGRIVDRQIAAIGDPAFDHEGVASVDGRRSRRRKILPPDKSALEAGDDELFADRHHAGSGGGQHFDFTERLVQPLDLFTVNVGGSPVRFDTGRVADALRQGSPIRARSCRRAPT